MRKTPVVILSALVAGILMLSIAPALAKTSEVSVNTVAWFGQDQFSREEKDPLGNTYTVESPNPFCPSVPGSLGNVPGTCAEGRLPIEVRGGNYEPEEQNKISAVGFDLSLIPLGSKVSKFTATFLEAKAGCYEEEESQDPKPVEHCEETDPINVKGKELQACFIDGFLTDGEGRPIKEAPRFTCSDSDPVAKRKEVKTKKGSTEHVWTFDLTTFAQTWVEELSATPSIMIIGHAPKEPTTEDTWRVVLTGPKFEADNIPGIETKVSFIPGEIPSFPTPPIDSGTTDFGSSDFGGSDFGSSDFGSSDFGSSTGSTDFGTSTGTDVGTGTEATAEDEAPAEAEEPPALAVEGADTGGPPMPGYVWLAILAGIIGFTLVRSAVLESASGIRPNGVLAQIQRLNADRHGVATTAAAAGTSPFAPLGRAFSGVKGKAGSLGSKLNFRKKG